MGCEIRYFKTKCHYLSQCLEGDSGKPRSGPILHKMYSDKSVYKNTIKMKKINADNMFSDALHDALSNKNMTSFWKVGKVNLIRKP